VSALRTPQYCPNCGGPTEYRPTCSSCGETLIIPPVGPFYRVVPVTARPDVEARGFLPAGEGIDGQPAGVYLWDTLDAAAEYVEDKDDLHDVYEVARATVEPDPLWNGYGSWVCSEAIPARDVRRIGRPGCAKTPWAPDEPGLA
jgi:hypothetical protein